jgi:hypothetical protein
MEFYKISLYRFRIIQARFMKIVIARESYDAVAFNEILETDNAF